MAKEWILNNVMNRFQLNFKRNVGPTSESIRKCKPKNLEEWKKYYYEKVKPKSHIDSLGKILYEKITTVIKEELGQISEEDCVEYMHNLVIDRTFEGYINEVEIIKGTLEKEVGMEIKEAPDEWDRLYGVDFFIKINDSYIGIQIKPEDIGTNLQVFAKYKEFLKEQHIKFTEKYKGKCFVVFSVKKNDSKVIQNREVIDEIKKEIQRLKNGEK